MASKANQGSGLRIVTMAPMHPEFVSVLGPISHFSRRARRGRAELMFQRGAFV